MPGPFNVNEHWLSAYVLCRSNIMHFDEDAGVVQSAPRPTARVPITVVVIVDGGNQYNLLTSLANLQYDKHEVFLVFRTRDEYEKNAGWMLAYSYAIPIRGSFRPDHDLTMDEAIVAALGLVRLPYMCLMFSDDMIHPHALGRAAVELKKGDVDYCTDMGFRTNYHSWATPVENWRPDNRLMVFSARAVRQCADKPVELNHPVARIWQIAAALRGRSVVLPELLYFHGGSNHDKDIEADKAYAESPYCDERGEDDAQGARADAGDV